jgi:multiple sugar transport system ATP-binding protein
MGSPRMNLVPARVAGSNGSLALDVGGTERARIRIDLPAAGAVGGYNGREVLAGIRAEAVSLARNGSAVGPMQRPIDARVVVIEPTGADTLAVLDLGGHELTARLEPDAALAPGQDARFLVDVTKLVCFDPETQQLIA